MASLGRSHSMGKSRKQKLAAKKKTAGRIIAEAWQITKTSGTKAFTIYFEIEIASKARFLEFNSSFWREGS